MFVHCIDRDLKEKLISRGFKLLKENDTGATFVIPKDVNFDFDKVDKSKFLLTNRLTF